MAYASVDRRQDNLMVKDHEYGKVCNRFSALLFQLLLLLSKRRAMKTIAAAAASKSQAIKAIPLRKHHQ